jgi:hypothetical protein
MGAKLAAASRRSKFFRGEALTKPVDSAGVQS